MLDDAVATQDTVTKLVAAIRRVQRLVPGAAAVLAARDTACDYARPGKPDIAWDDTAAKAVLVDGLGARTVGESRREDFEGSWQITGLSDMDESYVEDSLPDSF